MESPKICLCLCHRGDKGNRGLLICGENKCCERAGQVYMDEQGIDLFLFLTETIPLGN